MSISRSIFRYPGGKVRMAPVIVEQLHRLNPNPTAYCEPMVGGGGVLVKVALKWPEVRLFVADLNPEVAAFWTLIAEGRIDELCGVLEPLNSAARAPLAFYNECEQYRGPDPVLRARRLLVVNKGGFNGYIKPGTTPVGGLEQKGAWLVDWCWDVDKIRRQLKELEGLFKGRLQAECTSVFDYAPVLTSDLIYLDPPYVKEGLKMYGEYGAFNHEKLKNFVNGIRGATVISYDDDPLIRSLYGAQYEMVSLSVLSSRSLKVGRLTRKKEVLILKEKQPLTVSCAA